MSSSPPFQYVWTPVRPSVPTLSTSRTELVSIGTSASDAVTYLGFFVRGTRFLAW